MKKTISSIVFALLGITLFGQHQIEVTKVFEKNTQTSEVLLEFNLDQVLTQTELNAITEWANDNSPIVRFTNEGSSVDFIVKLTSFDRNVYLKAFMLMNISEVLLKDGKHISVEEFLSKNNL
ncbi:MAG: hypothetical protein RL204_1522 [Bacteroidota bacterium]|jgi:hypothetical protein